jgi:hypothetical protein
MIHETFHRFRCRTKSRRGRKGHFDFDPRSNQVLFSSIGSKLIQVADGNAIERKTFQLGIQFDSQRPLQNPKDVTRLAI